MERKREREEMKEKERNAWLAFSFRKRYLFLRMGAICLTAGCASGTARFASCRFSWRLFFVNSSELICALCKRLLDGAATTLKAFFQLLFAILFSFRYLYPVTSKRLQTLCLFFCKQRILERRLRWRRRPEVHEIIGSKNSYELKVISNWREILREFIDCTGFWKTGKTSHFPMDHYVVLSSFEELTSTIA